jgi:hypothetical protein
VYRIARHDAQNGLRRAGVELGFDSDVIGVFAHFSLQQASRQRRNRQKRLTNYIVFNRKKSVLREKQGCGTSMYNIFSPVIAVANLGRGLVPGYTVISA